MKRSCGSGRSSESGRTGSVEAEVKLNEGVASDEVVRVADLLALVVLELVPEDGLVEVAERYKTILWHWMFRWKWPSWFWSKLQLM